MWDYLLHLWATPPVGLQLSCPPAPQGTVANPLGFYDELSVRAAYTMASMGSATFVLVMILGCYFLTRQTSGRNFDRRWLISLVLAAVLCAAVSWLALVQVPVTALAGSCQSDPSSFPAKLPAAQIIARVLAGLVWGLLAFVVGSILLTRSFGRIPGYWNGFYHNRGTPWPRILPFGK